MVQSMTYVVHVENRIKHSTDNTEITKDFRDVLIDEPNEGVFFKQIMVAMRYLRSKIDRELEK